MADLLAGFAQGMMEGLRDAENRKFRQMELDARLKADQDQKARQKYLDKFEMRKAGFKVPEGDIGEIDPANLEYDPAYLDMQREKASIVAGADPYGSKMLAAQNQRMQLNKNLREESQAAKGMKLPPDKVLQVQQGAHLPNMLDDIETTLTKNQTIMGPVSGRAGAVNPYDTTAQSVDAQFRSAAQAFGRYMEGGVLRKEDEDKYRKMFPQLTDTPEVAKNKLAIVRKLLVDKQNADVTALKTQGYDTSGFSQLPSTELPGVLTGQKNGLMSTGMMKDGLMTKGGPAAPSNKVKVFNGKETLLIDPSDLADAIKDGFKVTK